MRVAGSHVVVTGGGRGIGATLAAAFVTRGAKVTVVGRTPSSLDAVAAATGADAVTLDLADADAVAASVPLLTEAHGPVDIVVHNAGLAVVGPAESATAEQLRDSVGVNVTGPLALTRLLLPSMLERRTGRMVFVSTYAAVAAVPTLGVYGATKAALAHYAAVLSRELTGTGVGVTVLTLGEVAGTDMMEAARESPTIAAVSARLARARLMPRVTPDVVARHLILAIESDRKLVCVPRRIAPLIGVRELASRVNDLSLIGIDKR